MIDIRIPIGLLFTVVGGLLLLYGIATIHQPDIYQKSFGTNANLWAGGLMLMFGIIMLWVSKGKRERE